MKIFKRVAEFLGNVKIEIKKVSFPSRAETIGSTMVVLVLVSIVGIYLAGVDQVLLRLMKLIIQ